MAKTSHEHGYHSRTIPKEYGGYGATPDILKSNHCRRIQQRPVNTGFSGQGISMLTPVLMEMGTEEQKQTFIKPTIEADIIWCQGYSEPGASDDLASLTTKAELDGDEWVINGQKIWTSTAVCRLDFLPCPNRTGGQNIKVFPFCCSEWTHRGLRLGPLWTCR